MITPLEGFVYNFRKVGGASKVLAPPYDVISETERKALAKKSPHNIVRLILSQEKKTAGRKINKYRNAQQQFAAWRKAGILHKEKLPTMYYYVQDFTLRAVGACQRAGILCRVELRDFADKKIFPHERTLAKPRKDRLRLLEACRVNFSPIFLTYTDAKCTIENLLEAYKDKRPFISYKDKDGIRHRLWKIQDPILLKTMCRALNRKQLIIADGHHRYSAALDYKKKTLLAHKEYGPEHPVNHTLCYLSNLQHPGMLILPIHRFVSNLRGFQREKFLARLSKYFDVTTFSLSKSSFPAVYKAFTAELEKAGMKRQSLGIYFPDLQTFMLLQSKSDAVKRYMEKAKVSKPLRALDVVLLHSLLFEHILGISLEAQAAQKNITYWKGDRDIAGLLKTEKFQFAVIMNAAKPQQIQKVVSQGEVLPQKATNFFPKVYSGLVLNPLDYF